MKNFVIGSFQIGLRTFPYTYKYYMRTNMDYVSAYYRYGDLGMFQITTIPHIVYMKEVGTYTYCNMMVQHFAM